MYVLQMRWTTGNVLICLWIYSWRSR